MRIASARLCETNDQHLRRQRFVVVIAVAASNGAAMLSASETLDGLEQLARDPCNTMGTRTLISGLVRIDLTIVSDVAHWRVNGLVCSRERAVDALEDARAARSDK